MSRAFDLSGKTFNGLEILRFKGKSKSGDNHWFFKCVCGKIHSASASHLKNEKVKSCGCLKLEATKKSNTTHGSSKTPLYRVWKTMKARCGNVNNEKYPRYGGRGVMICDEWLDDFVEFEKWSLENGYSDELSIDRIDNDGNYEPDNCRWATMKVQSRNTSQNRWIEFNGDKKILTDWAQLTGLKRETISARLDAGWSVEKSLTTPTKKSKLIVVSGR